MTHRIHYVTSNPGKFDEVRRFFVRNLPMIELVQAALDLPELQSDDQRSIALGKARAAWQLVGEPLMVDDSGVYFKHCINFPGTITKQVFGGIGYEGIFALTATHNAARFHLHLVYMSAPETFHIFEGSCSGIIKRPNHFVHASGFPWDPIFFPEDSEKSYADLSTAAEEEQYSYRMRALKKFAAWHLSTVTKK